jgi:hypothetical protein
MKETLSGVIAELEKAVAPLGFRIELIECRAKGGALIGAENGEDDLKVSIVRKGNLG